jgi:hypothetical protein
MYFSPIALTVYFSVIKCNNRPLTQHCKDLVFVCVYFILVSHSPSGGISSCERNYFEFRYFIGGIYRFYLLIMICIIIIGALVFEVLWHLLYLLLDRLVLNPDALISGNPFVLVLIVLFHNPDSVY